MEISKRGFITLAACAVVASLFAGHHHHRPLPPHAPRGAYWCHKCDGDGYNWTWYGWKKPCGVCDGRGWCVKALPPPPPRRVAPPPPPPPHKKPHHNPPPPPPAKGHKGGPRR